ncbi:aegerolysin family protein [Kitasatospora sp. McL0602]|uniref:aegerolysin family protein n=1 Tax=Kitasatospora sp. McL0602 TaxID=3439530 RepID=UPI003F8BE799
MNSLGTARIRRIGLRAAVGAVVAAATVAVPAGTAQAAQSARSAVVNLENRTGCELRLYDSWLDHGIWDRSAQDNAALVGDGGRAQWESDSNGFMTGTEGHAVFVTQNCAAQNLNRRVVEVHWDNPYYGSNSYDTNGTDKGCLDVRTSGGSGDNATVSWQVWGTPGSC